MNLLDRSDCTVVKSTKFWCDSSLDQDNSEMSTLGPRPPCEGKEQTIHQEESPEYQQIVAAKTWSTPRRREVAKNLKRVGQMIHKMKSSKIALKTLAVV